jgi:zinc transporter ZupT
LVSYVADHPVLVVLFYTSLAAASSAFGVLPFHRLDRVPLRAVGFAYALASGLMLGAGYILITEGLGRATLPVLIGAGLGVAVIYWTHSYTGTMGLSTHPEVYVGSEFVTKFTLLNTLHAASEGIAIGIAMVVSLKLGIFMALSLAVHNIAESMVLTDILRSRKISLPLSAAICVATDIPQIIMAVAAFIILPMIPGFLTWSLGVAAGAMVYLVMTELLPYSYERAGRTGIALVVSFAAGTVVLLKGFLG